MSTFNFSRSLIAGTPENVNDVQAMLNELRALVNGGLDSANIADGSLASGDLTTQVQASLLPVGAVIDVAGTTVPTGFLVADGTEVPVIYTLLIAHLAGNPHGVGAGGRPLLPDCRGRVRSGVESGTGRLTGRVDKYTTGGVGGTHSVTLAANELPTHTHDSPAGYPYATLNDPGAGAYFSPVAGGTAGSVAVKGEGVTGGVSGALNYGHSNVQPTIILTTIIRHGN